MTARYPVKPFASGRLHALSLAKAPRPRLELRPRAPETLVLPLHQRGIKAVSIWSFTRRRTAEPRCERYAGLEPALSVWKTDVLPLNTNIAKLTTRWRTPSLPTAYGLMATERFAYSQVQGFLEYLTSPYRSRGRTEVAEVGFEPFLDVLWVMSPARYLTSPLREWR